MPLRITGPACFAAAAIALGAAADLRSAQEQPTFRSRITYVEADVIVTDAEGRFVPGLTAADFEVLDRGKPQRIEFFEEVRLALPQPDGVPARASAAAPDVATNEGAAAGRLYLLVFDDLHISRANTIPVREAARLFVERFVAPDDLVAVACTSGRTDALQDFTTDRARLLSAVQAFDGRALVTAAAERAKNLEIGLGPRDYRVEERFQRAASTYQTIGRLADRLAPLRGRRKTMLVFSEGTHMPDGVLRRPTDVHDPKHDFPDPRPGSAADAHEIRRALVQAVSAANRANVHIYPVDPNGLGTASLDVTLQIPMDEATRALGVTLESFDVERLGGQTSLQTLAALTGGSAAVWTNGFEEGFSRVVRDSSNYYLLGYSPSPPPAEGSFASLSVRVKRPDVVVRARPGYYVAKPETARRAAAGNPALDDLLNAPLPVPDLPMRLAAAAFRETRRHAALLVAIDFPADAFVGPRPPDTLTIVYAITDVTRGARPAAAQTLDVRLPAATSARVSERGFRMTLRLALPPGRYQGRFGSIAGGRRGSVFADIDVPDFFATSLSWSGISMTSMTASLTPTRAVSPEAARALPVPPAAVRRFTPEDTIVAYAVAYENGAGAGDVELTALVRNTGGKTLFTYTEDRPSNARRGEPRGLGFRVDVPPGTLPPGDYVLTFSAVPRGGARPVWRDVPFEIVAQ